MDYLAKIVNFLIENAEAIIQIITLFAGLQVIAGTAKKITSTFISRYYRLKISRVIHNFRNILISSTLKSPIIRRLIIKNISLYLARSIIREKNPAKSISILFTGISVLIIVCFIEFVIFAHIPKYSDIANDLIISDTIPDRDKVLIMSMVAFYIFAWPIYIIMVFKSLLSSDNSQRRKSLSNLCKYLRRSGFRGKEIRNEAERRVFNEVDRLTRDIPQVFFAVEKSLDTKHLKAPDHRNG